MGNIKEYTRVLTIAGSDPSGGAGIQADLKTFSALGCYGMSVITAVVDENTVSVKGVHPIPAEFVRGQLISVLDDIGTDAVKIGMLHDSELIRTVRDTLSKFNVNRIVIDPVMVATSGDPLLQPEAVETLIDELLPLASIITPNVPEAEIILGEKIQSQDDFKEAAMKISKKCGGVSVFLKAGHIEDGDRMRDLFYDAGSSEFYILESLRIATKNTHGTGCTLSSAITAWLAKGAPLSEAAKKGKEYVDLAIKSGAAYRLGSGHGPVNHFHAVW